MKLNDIEGTEILIGELRNDRPEVVDFTVYFTRMDSGISVRCNIKYSKIHRKQAERMRKKLMRKVGGK